MTRKSLIALILLFTLSASLAYFVYHRRYDFSEVTLFQRPQSPEEIHCEEVVDRIQKQASCDEKWTTFQKEKKACFSLAAEGVPETENALAAVSNQFKELYFDIGRCFSVRGQPDQIKMVYTAGLSETDWELEGSISGLSAHQMMKREMELSLPSENNRCWDLSSLQKEMEKFVQSRDLRILKALIYSENSLEFAQPSSDVGGPLSFAELEEGFAKFDSQLKVQLKKKVGNSCFLTEGWGDEFPWRAFCFEPMGDRKCYYLRTLWAGFKSEEADFERQVLERESEPPSSSEE